MLLYTCKICKATEDCDRISVDDQTISRMYHLASGVNNWDDGLTPILCTVCYANLCAYIASISAQYEEEARLADCKAEREQEIKEDFSI